MKLKPLQDWAVILTIEPEEMTAAGIIIPDVAKDKPTEGIVLAIGPGKYKTEKGQEKKKENEKKKKFVATVLTPGQRIIYGKYSAREFELDGQTIVLVREEDVLGTVEEIPLAEKGPFEVAKKHAGPVMIKKKSEVMTVAAAPLQKIKPVEKKTVKKEKTAPKPEAKKEKKKTGTVKAAKKDTLKALKKASGKKTARGKTIIKKATPKPLKKTTSVKKVKVSEKKVAVKKTAVKKSVQKKTVIPKKQAVKKKTAVTGGKKDVPTKKAAPKKKQALRKTLTKNKARSKK